MDEKAAGNTIPASLVPRKRKERRPVKDGESVKRCKGNDPPLLALMPVTVAPGVSDLKSTLPPAAYSDRLTEGPLDSLNITPTAFLTALPKIQPSSMREGFAMVPDVTWADIGALDSLRVEMQTAIVQPIKTPELFASVGITAPAGILLWGPPGCVNTLLVELGELSSRKGIYVIAATNRPDAIDPAILSPGRLNTLLFVGLPNTEGRVEILKTITKKTPLSNVDLGAISRDGRCRDPSPTDVPEVREGGNTSNRQVVVTAEDFEKAFADVGPSLSVDNRERYRELAATFGRGRVVGAGMGHSRPTCDSLPNTYEA
ncbi:unnamed protein product [Tuber aestivum]|uniref:ATPase AAA-type core domain-containing protein n=1 Tax=Tuber aestivum TaxID=59557 RepID=A0A292PS49_9PEZI|nr:unnamed protein product [Tuber aestivum]